jgi:ADP-heptose:LPS heptosyltransferase
MINRSCRFYKGSRPCKFNKEDGSECPTCRHVSTYSSRVLIIKLDALGDVLRTGCLLPILAARHGAPYICWLTRPDAVEIVAMMEGVDEVLSFDVDGLARMEAGHWDHVYSLSNDYSSASLANIAAPVNPVVGYTVRDGVLHPSNEAAKHWLEMAAFDRLKKANKETYQKLMLDIIGESGSAAAPRLKRDPRAELAAKSRLADLFSHSSRPLLAINIGAGTRWPKKMLDAGQVSILVARILENAEVDIVLVGGRAEEGKAADILALCKNRPRVRAALSAQSFGDFVAILRQCSALLCGDTLALHIATAINLPTVCVVGPTSSAELAEFDGLVVKTSAAQLDCLGCYGDCQKADNCMSVLDMDGLVGHVLQKLQGAQQALDTIGKCLPASNIS